MAALIAGIAGMIGAVAGALAAGIAAIRGAGIGAEVTAAATRQQVRDQANLERDQWFRHQRQAAFTEFLQVYERWLDASRDLGKHIEQPGWQEMRAETEAVRERLLIAADEVQRAEVAVKIVIPADNLLRQAVEDSLVVMQRRLVTAPQTILFGNLVTAEMGSRAATQLATRYNEFYRQAYAVLRGEPPPVPGAPRPVPGE